jgi:uncharacterized damage-inducible protein DinB
MSPLKGGGGEMGVEAQSVSEFIKYWRGFRGRTRRTLGTFPADAGSWRPVQGAFCVADLTRHLGRAERDFFVVRVCGAPPRVALGAEAALGKGGNTDLKRALAELDLLHEESCGMLADLATREGPDALQRRVTTPVGAEITAWKWLRAMCEHEAHHRGQLALYLRMLGLDPPPIFGHKAEAVGEALRQEHARSVAKDQD